MSDLIKGMLIGAVAACTGFLLGFGFVFVGILVD